MKNLATEEAHKRAPQPEKSHGQGLVRQADCYFAMEYLWQWEQEVPLMSARPGSLVDDQYESTREHSETALTWV